MSNLDVAPDEVICGPSGEDGPEVLVLSARRVWLGRTTEVSRVLPDRDLRMVGAWCFLDHYGPDDITAEPGMRVHAHPHTGLQTVSWLLDGEVEHRDGIGSDVRVRPGELHIMTAGHGIVHSEMSPAERPSLLHGLQLWVALPDATRDIAPAFHSHRDLPRLEQPGVHGTVLVGTIATGEAEPVTSPAQAHTPLLGVDLTLDPATTVRLRVDPDHEHGVFVISGAVSTGAADGVVEHDVDVRADQLVYLGLGRSEIVLTSATGGRVMVLGGAPFAEDLVMWWNFVGRSHDEIVGYRDAWVRRDDRFAPVVSREEKVMEAPPLPTVALKARPRRSARSAPPTAPAGVRAAGDVGYRS